MNLFKKAVDQLNFIKMFADRNPAIGCNFADVYSNIKVWNEQGPNTFYLSDLLVEAFMNTDVPNDVSPSDFRYPHNSFLIENENGLFDLDDAFGRRHTVKAVLCNLRESFAGEPIGIMKKDGIVSGSSDDIMWKIMIMGIFLSKTELDIGMHEFIETACLCLGDDQKVCDLDKNNTRMFSVELDDVDIQNLTNIVFNTVAYLSDPNRSMVETQEVRYRSFRIRDGKGKDNFEKQMYVFLKPPKRYSNAGIPTGMKMSKRFWVRGHWRWQAYGKNFSERKHTWILPFQKGPVEGDKVSRTYVVEES